MKTTSWNLKIGMLLLAPLVFATSTVKAVTTLADLLAGGTITSGNLVFFNFHAPTQHSTVPSLDSAGYAHISVSPIGTLETDFGIRFQSDLWHFESPSQDYDLGFKFNVRTLTGTAITGNTLSFSGDLGAAGSARAKVAETVHDVSLSNALATPLVLLDGNDSALFSRLTDHRNFVGGPYSELAIGKDFGMFTREAEGSAVRVDYFDQTFSQPTAETRTTVPEGGPGLVVSASVLGVLCWAGRKKHRKPID